MPVWVAYDVTPVGKKRLRKAVPRGMRGLKLLFYNIKKKLAVPIMGRVN